MATRRALLRSAAAVPLLASGRSVSAQGQAPAPPATPVVPPPASPVADLSGVAPLPLTGAALAAFEADVAARLAELGVPGAAVAVAQGGAVPFLQGFGVRSLRRPEPVTADTLLRIGSVTKSFSSLLAATLVDAGRARWDTPLVDLLPTFAVADPALTPRLTLADAFCACTGLPRRDWEFIFNAGSLTPERLVASIVRLPLTAPYGTKYQYNNQIVAAGGFAAAVADGGSPTDLGPAYAIALRERVLDPIGMPRSTLALAEAMAGDDYAMPHVADITGALQTLPLLDDDLWLRPVAPSGALWSSAREMVRYVQTGLNRGVAPDGARVVSADNLARTWRPGVALPAPPPETSPALAAYARNYALGWVIGSYGGQRLVWHSGGTFGFTSLVTLLPEADLGVVVLTNAVGSVAGPFATGVTFRLLELLFDQPPSIDAALAGSQAAATQARADFLARLGAIDATSVAPYLGRWTNPDLGAATLTWQAGSLIFDAGGLRSAVRPLRDADGTVVGDVLIDPPLGGFPPELRLQLAPDGAGGPHLTLMAEAGRGEAELVYPFTRIAPTATPSA